MRYDKRRNNAVEYGLSNSLIGKAIQSGTPLDNLRAEIDRQEKWLVQAGYTPYNTDIAFDTIKSVLRNEVSK